MASARLISALLLATAMLRGQSGWDIPHRGALVYDRQTELFEVTPPPSALAGETLIAGAQHGGHEWRYFAGPANGAPDGFEQPAFDDRSWPLGRGEFGTDAPTNPTTRTAWSSPTLAVRAEVQLLRRPRALVFDVAHDDGVRIWLNGTPVVSNDGYGRNRRYVVSGNGLDGWQRGRNVLAARCVNTGGAQYLDIAMTVLDSLPRGMRDTAEIEAMLREAREAANKVQRELFGEFRAPGLLLQGELDDRGEHVRIPPADLRDIAWWIATDVRCGQSGGSVRADATRLFRLGDLEIKGRATPVDDAGWQTITATIENTDEPAPGDDGKRHVDRFVMPFVWYGFDGTLTVRRRLDQGEAGLRVTEFTSELSGRVLRGKNWKEHAADVAQRESWKLTAVRDNQDAEFRALVHRALQAGVRRLREQIKDVDKGNLSPQAADGNRSYHSGRLALALLALVKGGIARDDEVLQQGYAALRQRALIDTYSLGNAMMAIEALYAPANEISDLKSGALAQPRKRTPSPDDRRLLQEWTDRLLTNLDTRVDPAYLLRFHYVAAADYDNSVNQYGLLGLYSAHLCGIEISPQVWEAAANHLIASQSPEGPRVALELVDYRTLAQPDAGATQAKVTARAAGWNYKDPKSGGLLTPTWGSMTAAGITGLAICQAALADYPGIRRTRLQSDATRARLDGFAWFAKHMTFRCHAGAIERQQRWFYYYAYGLERAALLSGIALIQDRDWYFEAAMVLALTQKDDGNWPGELSADHAIETNAMAILCLAKSTAPALTGK